MPPMPHDEDPAATAATGADGDAPVVVNVDIERTTRVIWILVVVLIVATFAAQLFREAVSANTVVNLLDSDQKLNFPTTLKLLLMLTSTGLFALVGLATAERRARVRWLGMAVIFGLVTLDEFTYMHQRLSDAIHDAVGTGGVLRFAWIVVYLPLLVVVAIVYLPFWRNLARRLRYQLLAAAILFAGGSAGVELAKGALYDDDQWSLTFGLVASVSDSLELIGLALLVAALLEYVTSLTRGVTFLLRDD
jgi:hypothetical protein